MNRSELLNASREMMETDLDICWNSDSSNLDDEDEDQEWGLDRYKVVILNDRLMSETAETEHSYTSFNNNSCNNTLNAMINSNSVVMVNHHPNGSLNGLQPSTLHNHLVLDPVTSAPENVTDPATDDDDSYDSFAGVKVSTSPWLNNNSVTCSSGSIRSSSSGFRNNHRSNSSHSSNHSNGSNNRGLPSHLLNSCNSSPPHNQSSALSSSSSTSSSLLSSPNSSILSPSSPPLPHPQLIAALNSVSPQSSSSSSIQSPSSSASSPQASPNSSSSSSSHSSSTNTNNNNHNHHSKKSTGGSPSSHSISSSLASSSSSAGISALISVQPKNAASGTAVILTEEEKRTLVAEGYPIPTRFPLTKAEERSLKKIRRKIKNKISAQESRRKKKEYVEELEKRVQQLDARVKELESLLHLTNKTNHHVATHHQLTSAGGTATISIKCEKE